MTGETKFVEYRGALMIEGWPEKIKEAQTQPVYQCGDEHHPRIPHNQDRPCHDCAVLKGEFHVSGCDDERCPICKGQYISCGCFFDEEES
jgi:hypothetical protein